ncbi:MAG: hypothetical protein L0099_01245, partial [Acidobacteria bacterium]|nr:hypothetical protein [Acidobacteriota bacterium]
RLQQITDLYGPEAAEHAAAVGADERLGMVRREELKKEAEERADKRARGLASFQAELSQETAAFKAGLAESRTLAAEARARSTPEGIAARKEAQVRGKLIDEGPGALTPGERASIGGLGEFLASQKPRISPAQEAALQKQIEDTRQLQAAAQSIRADWFPEYFDAVSPLKFEFLKGRSKLAETFPRAALTAEEAEFVQRYAAMDSAVGRTRIKELERFGANLTERELNEAKRTIPGSGDDRISAATKADKLSEIYGLAALRAEISLEVGYSTQQGAQRYDMGDTRKMVGTFANAHIGDLTERGVDPIEAKRQVKEMLLTRYGLNLDNFSPRQAGP